MKKLVVGIFCIAVALAIVSIGIFGERMQTVNQTLAEADACIEKYGGETNE